MSAESQLPPRHFVRGAVPPTIQTVADVLNRHALRWLLMGGQACVAYGASEFSRDVDIVVLADLASIASLGEALEELDAHVIAVPPFEIAALVAGHAVHFRCRAAAVAGLRIDVMSRLRGVDPFPDLWRRRIVLPSGVPMLALPDLVAAKKTQRDKDWPMIRRLVEADYFARREQSTDELVEFWLRECRTPALLVELVAAHPVPARASRREVVRAAVAGDGEAELERLLDQEMLAERVADRAYWAPLKQDLERMRLDRQRGGATEGA